MYLSQAYRTEAYISKLDSKQIELLNAIPSWVTAVFAIAVFAGTLACIGMLLRKAWSVKLFILSFIAVIVQQVYNFFIQDFVEVTGQKMFMPITIVIVAGFLMWYSKGLKDKGMLT